MLSRLSILALLALAPTTWAKSIEPMSFRHESWEVVCSNIGTCRAAGYPTLGTSMMPEMVGQDGVASILITRHAGPKQSVQAQWVLKSTDTNGIERKAPQKIVLWIQGQNFGEVLIRDTSPGFAGVFNEQQTHALLLAAKQTGDIVFRAGQERWLVSSQGMAAVLLKMDEFQQRLDTTGALMTKGLRSEEHVLRAVPKMQIRQVKTAAEPYATLLPNDKRYAPLKQKLLAAMDKPDYCNGEEWGGEIQRPEIALYRLNNTTSLATKLCWVAAHNEGMGAWVINRDLQGKAVFVTDLATEIKSGAIWAEHRNRWIDCWNNDEWTWDGKQFIHSRESWTGKCIGIVYGAWQLDSIETDIIKE